MEISKNNVLSPTADLFCIGMPQTSEASICTLINYKRELEGRLTHIIDTYCHMFARGKQHG